MCKKHSKYIVCTIDDNYVEHCVVMLTSLFYNNKKSNFHVFILTNKLLDKNINCLETFFKWKKHSVEIINVDESLLKDAPISGHLTLATYYRILIPLLLPIDIDRVLFLDSDLIVKESVDSFWDSEITNFSHIAIQNMGDNLPFVKKIGMPFTSKYFNAGILFINLKWWREKDVFSQCIDFISTKLNRITFHDQDVLNGVLVDCWLEYPLKFNAQSYVFFNNSNKSEFNKEENDALSSPVIIHYTGSGDSKPWYYNNRHLLKHEYYKYLDKTVFKNSIPIGTPKFKVLTRRDKFYIFRMKIINKIKCVE